jgi:hypothetical protein
MSKKQTKDTLLQLFCVSLIVVMVTACSGGQGQEEAAPLEEEEQEPAPVVAVEEVPVMYQEMQYPGSEFLFEVPGVGGPMFPCRFYVANDASTDQAAQYYLENLPWFSVEQDEVVEGQRHLQTDNSSQVMDPLGQVEDPEDLVNVGNELDGRLVGVEVVHSDYTGGFTNLAYAAASSAFGNQIPPDATIIVLVYFSNPY